MLFVKLPAADAVRLSPSGPIDDDDLAEAFQSLDGQLGRGDDPIILSLHEADTIASAVPFWLGRADGQMPDRLGEHPAEEFEAILALDELRAAARSGL